MPAKILGGAAEVYFKPTTGQLIIRKLGINTDSEAWKNNVVPQINRFSDKMKGHSFPSHCKGKKWKEFKACLRREGREQYS